MTDKHPLKAGFHTLGCKTNHYETDAVADRFRQAGFTIVGFDEAADVYVLNTCTVTAEADRKSRQFMRRARSFNESAIVVALGCHAQLNQDSQLADIVIGTQGKLTALDRVLERLKEKDQAVDNKQDRAVTVAGQAGPVLPVPLVHVTGDQASSDTFDEYGPVSQQSETRAYIKVEDGCDNFCTYCAIPLARGRVRSRDPGRVLEEAARLAEAGYREVVLTGIHICSYGADQGLGSHALAELAIRIGQVPGIARIRLGSLEPQSITLRFVQLAAAVQGLCPHFHLSLQSGSDPVLKQMNRQYDTKRFRESAALVRDFFPSAALTTDVMVGFPGEDEQMHRQSMDFIREIGFSRLHVFRYSRRSGTAAATMPDQVPKDVAIRRSAEMQALGNELAQAFHSCLIGQIQTVLVEQIRDDGQAAGYTDSYVPVLIAEADGLKPNQLVKVIPNRCDHEFLYAGYAQDTDS